MDFLQVFRALGDETRLRLVNLFVQTGKSLCVCEMVDALQLPQYQVSRHLSLLRHLRVVRSERRGTWVYYEANWGESPCLDDLLRVVRRHFRERYQEDVRRMQERLALRRDGVCVIGYAFYEKGKSGTEPVRIETGTKGEEGR